MFDTLLFYDFGISSGRWFCDGISAVFGDDFVGGFWGERFFFVDRLTGGALFGILGAVGAMARTTHRPRRASDRSTRIMRTNAVFAVLSTMTSPFGTALLTDPFSTGLVGPTAVLIITGVFLAFVIFADFIGCTIACLDALAFAAVFAIRTSDPRARIRCTFPIDALLPGLATIRITIGRHTAAPPTKLIARTLHPHTKILAPALFAHIAVWTSDVCTRFPDTKTTFTRLTLWTLFVAALGTTTRIHAFGSAVATGRPFVHLAVAVVIFSVADLGLWLGGGACVPIATYAALLAFTTSGRTLARQTFVDLSIAVVVLTVANFGCWGLSLLVDTSSP